MKENSQDIFNAIIEIESDSETIVSDKIKLIYQMLDLSLDLHLKHEAIKFTTLFAKISWVVSHLKLTNFESYLIQSFRRNFERKEISKEQEVLHLNLGINICKKLVLLFLNNDDNSEILNEEESIYFNTQFTKFRSQYKSFESIIEGLILQIDQEKKTLIFLPEHNNSSEKVVHYDVPDKNELFTSNINSIEKIFDLPVSANLIDVSIDKNDEYFPAGFVLNPDYLIDVTSIANAFKDEEGEHWLHALNKLMYKGHNTSIIVGNIANNILDDLIQNQDAEFEQLIKKIFIADPMSWSLLDDDQVKEVIFKLKIHFTNLKKVITSDFQNCQIHKSNVYLEPSFYCRDFGIQGRLDLLHVTEDKGNADIVELKSSKPFKPNSYGITQSHYLQTMLYDLIIQSTYLNKCKSSNYILYSGIEADQLKYAPRTKAQKFELMKTRNELMQIEHALARTPEFAGKIVNYLRRKNFHNVSGFTATDLSLFESLFASLNSLEKSYYLHFLNFISKEQILAKTGEFGLYKSNGLASLWLENIDEKIERFAILNHLNIVRNDSDLEIPLIRLAFTEYSSKLSSFRVGDIVVLYPHSFNSFEIMHHQILKATIIELNSDFVEIKLRSSQKNQSVFREFDFWNIEQDVLDSSFRHMFRNLFMFTQSEEDKRKMLLGLRMPGIALPDILNDLPDYLTTEQKTIINKIFYCKEYFLLWGPPGTGKTSVIIKELSNLFFNKTNERVLYLAYTNRAVDEICDALIAANLENEIIRIGSSFSISEKHKHLLLNNQIKNFTKRKQILEILHHSRVYVSTVSSILGKLELFDILEFDTVIIDEASQILEPMLIGLLQKFKRFVMIGDHKQLPAVVTQNKSESIIKTTELREMGITDMRMSLFERLYYQCKDNNWFHAWDIISYQGRMHNDILNFVSKNFYENKLKSIEGINRLHKHLNLSYNNEMQKILASNRMIFINTEIDKSFNVKTNYFEAKTTARILKELIQIFHQNELKINKDSIGIITPYRAQISLIRQEIGMNEDVTVDTVERYQGGARDIIIISLCTNKLSQMNTLVSQSNEGIDRKLNVAITRAKEQLIIIGNAGILNSNSMYQKLIEQCVSLKM